MAEEIKDLKDLQPSPKNPRKMDAEKYKLLDSSLDEFGDLSGVVFNTSSGELVGGHQRTNAFKKKKGKLVVTERFDKPSRTGTVANGYIVIDGEKFNYREVEWEQEKADRANILANKVSGIWDYDKLANEWDADQLLASGFTEAELGFTTVAGDDSERDENKLSDSLESYLGGNIKHIALYFKKEEFDGILVRMDKVMAETGTDSHTNAFLALLSSYENNRSK